MWLAISCTAAKKTFYMHVQVEREKGRVKNRYDSVELCRFGIRMAKKMTAKSLRLVKEDLQ